MKTVKSQPINWNDVYFISDERKILTYEQLHVPGLRMFGYQSMQSVIKNLPAHYHDRAYEFSFIVKGEFNFSTEDMEYPASGGEVVIAYPNEVHSSNDQSMTLHQQYWFQLDVSDPAQFLFLEPACAMNIISRLELIKRHVVKINRTEAMRIMHRAFSSALSGGSPILTASSITLFLELLLISETKPYLPADIEKALSYIDEHLCEEISLEEIAKECNLSVSRFKQKFTQAVGKSPRAHINGKKIDLAKTILPENQSVTKTAMDLGFNNISYFSSVFKKYTLRSPREYLTEHHNNNGRPNN